MARVRCRFLVKPTELADELGVSPETIRRDLIALQEEGLVRRVYGGATGTASHAGGPWHEELRVDHRERKVAIARVAASLVEPSDTLILGVGATVAVLAEELPAAYRGIVLTNSLPAARVLANRDGIGVITSGGWLRSRDLACFGPVSEAFFRDHFADKAFVGAGGLHSEMGLTDVDLEEIATRRVILKRAAKRYVLADSSRLGHVALERVCNLAALTAVITDDGADASDVARLEEAGLAVMIATIEDGMSAG